MMREQDIKFAIAGQSLVFEVPEGRPDSVTSVEVFAADIGDDGTAELATDGAATIEAPAPVALSAAAGPGQVDPRSLSLADASDIIAEKTYLLEENGQREWIEPLQVVANDLALRHPLANSYTTGAEVSSTRIVQALDDSWVADKSKFKGSDAGPQYRVRWTYVVGGLVFVRDSYFSLVRYPGDHEVTALDVDDYCSGFLESLAMEHQGDQGRSLIDSAYKRVATDLRRDDIDDAAVREADVLAELVIRKTVVLWLQGDAYQRNGSLEALIDARDQYAIYLNQFVRKGGDLRTDTAGSGAAEPTKPRNIWQT